MSELKGNYAIVRFAKLKTTGAMAASAAHNFRREQPDNADPSKACLDEVECYHKSRVDKLTQAVFLRYIPHDISQR